MSTKTGDFPGGLHLDGHKALSSGRPVEAMPVPPVLVFPLHQHIGEPAVPVVEVGERVLAGQLIARAGDYVSAPVHASTSGRVAAIEKRPVPHPSGLHAECIVVEADGDDREASFEAPGDFDAMDLSALRNRIREAGIVGMGGAGFPTFIKLNPGPQGHIDTVVLNGAECEPYITCDDRLMQERAADVVGGALIIRHAVGANRCVIGVEDNKPQAAAALRAAARDGVTVQTVVTRYPAGGEKQLIKILTGREVPSDGLPLNAGVVVQNVATAAAINHAVSEGRPLIARVVTVTGPGVAEPRNLEVRLGTPMADVLSHCGADPQAVGAVVVGGSMMGFAIHDVASPVVKTTNCLLVDLAVDDAEQPQMPCIRCGACVEVCPQLLLPQQLYWYAKSRDFDKVQDYSLFDCIECGCCNFVCPSHIPLASYFRFAKNEIWAQERERLRADRARERHEFNLARKEQEERERQERQRRKKARLKEPADAAEPADPKKAVVQEALKRAQARKEGLDSGTEGTEKRQ